jgi:hypothetical protein
MVITAIVKGMTNMKYIHPVYKTRKVREYVRELINDYGYKSFSDLSYADKCSFASILMEACFRNGDHECITESKDFEKIVICLRKSLSGTSSYQDDENLLYQLKDNAVNYHEETMEALFNDIFDDEIVSNKYEEVYSHANP